MMTTATAHREAILVRENALLALNLCLHVVDGAGRCEGLDEDLHASTEMQDGLEGRLL